jgi:hypothetical protein
MQMKEREQSPRRKESKRLIRKKERERMHQISERKARRRGAQGIRQYDGKC